MLGFLSKLFGGSKSEKDVQKLSPIVEKINQYFQQYQSLTNDELRNKTQEFRQRIKSHLQSIDDEIASLTVKADAFTEDQIQEKDATYQEIDKLRKERDKKIEEVLEEIHPEAFAVVKEAARRFTNNEELKATATQLDKDLVVKRPHMRIEGDQVFYKKSWLAGGSEVTWNMVHYDVQLIGGSVLHQGKIAEMATGEGKTLVSTLPAYLNALPGEGVHLVTVNDYLARRDSEWNGTLFEFLGLTVDCIDKHQPNSEDRRKAYMADIVYGTNNEFGFDYLRDNMVVNTTEKVQRKLHFAMVDEVDSILIDEARTPLIIAGPVGTGSNEQQFHNMKPRIEKLVDAQKRLVQQYLNEAKKSISEGDDDPKSGGLALMRAWRGLPKYGPLIKYLSEPGIKVKLQKAENYYLADQQKEMPKVDEGLLFHIDEKSNSVDLTDKGLSMITKDNEDPNFFVLPDISTSLATLDRSDLVAEEKLRQKEVFLNEYSAKADRIHTILQMLKAYSLFEKDVEYVVLDGQVKIVDEQTGRILDGRRYSDGLHQAIEAKENVHIEAATQTYATITLQNYFRMYHKLCGMTGTAETEAGEFWDIYKLDVVKIPTNLNMIRDDKQDLVYKTKREKYKAVIEEIEAIRAVGRPVLVGTTSVEVSELLSKMLQVKKIPHNVLNAKQHAREAQVVAEAGLPSAVTIATNMAGRGTDIKLGAGVKEAGGLAILGTERHDSRRVDRQLRGRAGRQGDPGSSQFYVSLEDDLMRMFGSDRIAGMMDKLGYKEGEVIQHSMITKSIERAQKKVEENNFGIRKRLLEYDDVMNKQRGAVYTRRNHALSGERLTLDTDNAFYSVADGLIASFKEQNDHEGFKTACIINFGIDTQITAEQLDKADSNTLAEALYVEAKTAYLRKSDLLKKDALPVFQNIKATQGSHIENVFVPFSDGKRGLQVLTPMNKTIESQGAELVSALERTATLAFIDEAWKEHLRAMDDLRTSVQNATYEQKDPLVIYKVEAYTLFEQLNSEINKNIVSFLAHAGLPVEENTAGQIREGRQQKTDMSKMRQRKEDMVAAGGGSELMETPDYYDPSENVKQEPIIAGPKIGRNDPCPCGSGKKYKQCHGKDL
ncbi:preprotein translocase subunit SecA [Lacibacter sp. H375]|uniref:preprotein translocase subunit SecA n=1 Tax=Lacibacter sp. H375 TaxID=3133424 RepID=UPI0030C38B50